MRAINHAATGAVIAIALHGSWVAVPIAFASHFALDSLPHFGTNDNKRFLKSVSFEATLAVDALLCLILVLLIFAVHPTDWFVIVLSAFAATSPDFMWVNGYLRAKRQEAQKPLTNWLMRFHHWIQWYQRPPGTFVEVVWFITVAVLLIHLL